MTAAVRVRGGTARLGTKTVWSGVDVEIAAGEFAAVLGPNGAGKSTLLKVVLGQIPLAAGAVEVLGGPPKRENSSIGYLPQRHGFDASVRVRGVDLVRLGVDGDRWGVPLPRFGRPSRVKRAVDELVHLVGAAGYAHRPIGQLSGGEQQRILIAQALARHPALLLLDEPLDSLDLPNQASVASLIAAICRAEGIAVLLVAHDVNPILPFLDKVVYFGGGAAATGRPEDVVRTDTLTELYGSPVEVLRASDGRLVVVGHPDAPAHHADRHEH